MVIFVGNQLLNYQEYYMHPVNNSFIFKLVYCLVLIAGCVPFSAKGAVNISVTGSSKDAIIINPESSTGLTAVVVVYNVAEVDELLVSGLDTSTATVQKFSNLGGGYAQEIPFTIGDGYILVAHPEGDMGYIFSDGSISYYFWLVNYADKVFKINSVSSYPEQECENTKIEVQGEGAPIHYYSINGRQCTLSRDIKVGYQNLVWDDDQKMYYAEEQTKTFENLTNPLTINPPFYCNTTVTVTGDKFLEHWGMASSAESNLIQANGLDAKTEAVQTNINEEEGSNMIASDGGMLGGSAPADFTFYAYVTDGVIHDEWQMADDPNFEYIKYRFYERDLNYTFDEEGKYYMRYVGSNADGSCTVEGDTYEIGIGASDLRIPNAFSPDGDGVNDVWKVGYRSLIEFKCWIFDRNGRQLCYFDRPEQGWDGTSHGKTVNPGVYYYVIEAKGADGKKYKKGGDINIIKYRKIGNSNSSSGE